MSDITGSLSGIIPVVVTGGIALAFTDRFLGGKQGGKRKKPFDKLEERDKKEKGMGFGDFSNIGF